jgi:hypothetical protein
LPSHTPCLPACPTLLLLLPFSAACFAHGYFYIACKTFIICHYLFLPTHTHTRTCTCKLKATWMAKQRKILHFTYIETLTQRLNGLDPWQLRFKVCTAVLFLNYPAY